MKTKRKLIFCFMMLIILISSCKLNKTIFSSKKVDKLNKVALISTFVRFNPPTDISLATPVMNEKINSISGELNLLFEDYATLYRDSLGKFISENYNCEVLYGESLQSNPGFEKLKTDYNFPDALATGNGTFPLIFLSSGDIYPFPLSNESKGEKTDSTILIKTIQDICRILDVNFIAVSNTTVFANSGNTFQKGTLSLFTIFSISDKDGDNIVFGNKLGAFMTPIKANKIEEYPPILNTFYEAIKPMLSEIYSKYSTK